MLPKYYEYYKSHFIAKWLFPIQNLCGRNRCRIPSYGYLKSFSLAIIAAVLTAFTQGLLV